LIVDVSRVQTFITFLG